MSTIKLTGECHEDVNRLLVEIEAFKTANADLSEVNTSRRNHINNAKKAAGIGPLDDLVGAVESLRKDAERYERLKLDANRGGSLMERLDCNIQVTLWDDAIDAANLP